MGGEVSILGDIYSFGVLLLEMFTGKRPTDDIFKDGLSIHNFTAMALPERVMDTVDLSMPFAESAGDETNNNDIEKSARIWSFQWQKQSGGLLGLSVADWTLVLCNITSREVAHK
jgi:serine/threonine protein kinase